MEDNQLNFNRPILSVRRFSSTVSSQKDSKRKNGISPSPSYKSGSLRNPGSVPFVWEHTPGKPKDETKTQKHIKYLVPKPPPGRISKPKKQESLEVKLTEFESSKETKKESSDSRVMNEKPLEVKKVVNRENEKPQITYGPNFLQFTGDDSEEDSDFDYDEHENTSYKVCGLLPHFCLKGSIGLLNPLPGLSMRTRLPISSANKTPSESSSASSQPARVAVYEHRSLAKQEKEETVIKNKPKEAANQKERSEPLDRVISDDDIDLKNKEVNLQKKGLISFKELLAVENEKESSPQNHMVEKTLYIDTIHKVETAKSDEGIFEISHIPKQEKEAGFCEDPKVERDLKFSRQNNMELPAPPPLPKSPSDSWLWRTLPSMSSKNLSLRANPNPKHPTSNTRAKLENFQSQNPQGQLLPIPET
ncbi:uncharacterized protein LOC111889321 [Lactuca sativa]|uniref:uncharacterized protein LOC111889321 n=1 Tax=Lactuca sativa TaxID=4236 RepID=UPI000CD8711F|nr:uncharacterized protein LOC111889321 [Lactuca sativa]XP_023741223.1 uncharacterized protein LOC111889321 [Lactuca sativa]XP_023741224.1 uncharacterized protein LOC111889321 [Lactuca sativa]